MTGWHRRHWFDFFQTDNLLLTLDDWTPFQVPNPLGTADPNVCCPDGGAGTFTDMITIYNRNRNALGRDAIVRNTTAGSDDRRDVYNGVEFGFNARLPGGGNLFGGLTVEKLVELECDSVDDPNTFRFCDRGRVDRETGIEVDIPWRNEVKLAGNYVLPFDVELAASWQSYPGLRSESNGRIVYNWTVPAALYRAAGVTRTESVSVPLNPPGSLYEDRKDHVDLGFSKRLDLGRGIRWRIGVDVYSVLNSDDIVEQRDSTADSPGPNFGRLLGQLTVIWDARFWKVSTRLQW